MTPEDPGGGGGGVKLPLEIFGNAFSGIISENIKAL